MLSNMQVRIRDAQHTSHGRPMDS